MADRESDIVFCHACQNEWRMHEHGLQCPQCSSEFCEVIEQNHDPRDHHVGNRDDEMPELESPTELHHTLHNHNHWAHEAPDPEEDNIEHVEWNEGPNIHFSRTSYRSSQGVPFPPTMTPHDPMAPIFGIFSQAFNSPQARAQQRQRQSSPPVHSQAPGGPFNSTNSDFPPISPLQQGPARHGHGFSMTFTGGSAGGFRSRENSSAQAGGLQMPELHNIIHSLFTTMENHTNSPSGPNPFHVVLQMLNPGNAAHGDAVYTEEALDRIISQMLDAQNGTSAPGPASPAAIAALPKKKVEKGMMGSDGKAECSVCMDNVEIGDEVTVLPCTHWFHGECVGMWLKEHDTCPHCRQGIMPKAESENTQAGARSPRQEPRNRQMSGTFATGTTQGSRLSPGILPQAMGTGQGSRQNPFRMPSAPPSPLAMRPRDERRASSRSVRSEQVGSSGGGGGGSVGGFRDWVRNRWTGGGSGEGH